MKHVSEDGMRRIRENGSRTFKLMHKRKAEQKEKDIIEYYNHPNYCFRCNAILPYEKRTNKFCSHSCSAIVGNTGQHKHPKNCPNCNNIIYEKRKTYCNLKCQGQYTRKIATQKWKETGMGHKRVITNYLSRKQEFSCAICSNTTWNNLPIPLELDHINGNSRDDKEENVRLLCPNCHAQTAFYKGKNRGNGRFARAERYRNGQSY